MLYILAIASIYLGGWPIFWFWVTLAGIYGSIVRHNEKTAPK